MDREKNTKRLMHTKIDGSWKARGSGNRKVDQRVGWKHILKDL